MGYFSNSSEHMDYVEHHCDRCIHAFRDMPCPVMTAHELFNYEECNKPESTLHMLIPRALALNLQCLMFIDRGLMSNLGLERYGHDQRVALDAAATAIHETERKE